MDKGIDKYITTQEKEIADYYEMYGLKETRTKYGIPFRLIKYILDKTSTPLKRQGEPSNFNHEAFLGQNQEAFYWLGWIASKITLKRNYALRYYIRIGVSDRTFETTVKFMEFAGIKELGTTHPRLCFTSKPVVEQLRKGHIDSPHSWRGYFDGTKFTKDRLTRVSRLSGVGEAQLLKYLYPENMRIWCPVSLGYATKFHSK
jgi:hypothetical protein